jgi:hypothetical protein
MRMPRMKARGPLRFLPGRRGDSDPLRRFFKGWKALIPMAIGLGIAAWMFASSWNSPVDDSGTTQGDLLRGFTWSGRATAGVLLAMGCVLLRDFSYIYRLRVLSEGTMNWRQCFDGVVLWELASAITPSAAGGSTVAVLIFNRQGMPMGRSLSVVFVASMLDELFYLVAVPIALAAVVLLGGQVFPDVEGLAAWGNASIPVFFWTAYGLIAAFTTLVWWGIVRCPERAAALMVRVVDWGPARRWKPKMVRWGEELVLAGAAMRGASRGFWWKAFGATAASWTGRFLTLNAVLLIFFASVPHAAVLGRQLVMWLTLLFSPTPGSSGFAELALPAFLGDLTGPGFLVAVAVVWRLFTYVPYLVVGFLVLPGWLVRTGKTRRRRRGTPATPPPTSA